MVDDEDVAAFRTVLSAADDCEAVRLAPAAFERAREARILDPTRLMQDPPLLGFAYLASVMLLPEDIEAQEWANACLINDVGAPMVRAPERGGDFCPITFPRFLRTAARPADVILACNFVGWALLTILRAVDEGRPKQASRNATLREGRRVFEKSSSTLDKGWRTHGAAAHLWAAARVVGFDMLAQCAENSDAIRHLVAVAESIRRRGEAWVPLRGRPILDAAKTWKAPAGYLAEGLNGNSSD